MGFCEESMRNKNVSRFCAFLMKRPSSEYEHVARISNISYQKLHELRGILRFPSRFLCIRANSMLSLSAIAVILLTPPASGLTAIPFCHSSMCLLMYDTRANMFAISVVIGALGSSFLSMWAYGKQGITAMMCRVKAVLHADIRIRNLIKLPFTHRYTLSTG